MFLKGVLAISGHPGLYKLVSQAKNGIIVECLETKKRMPAYTTSKISALEDIAIYTDDKEVALFDIFKNIHTKENAGPAISHKEANEKLTSYFSSVLPNYDRERVYVSDIKKVISWYNTLQKLNLIDFTEEAPAEEQKVEEVPVDKEVEAKPKKKKAAKSPKE